MDHLQVLALIEASNPTVVRFRETTLKEKRTKANSRSRAAAMLRSAADRLEPKRLAHES